MGRFRLTAGAFTLALAMAIAAAAAAPIRLVLSEEPFALALAAGTPVLEVYRAWGERAGIDVRPDPDLQDQRVEIDLAAAPARDSLRVLQRVYGHFHVVLDERTLLVVDDTPQKRRQYEDFEVRLLQLQHVSVHDATTLLRSTIGVRHFVADKALRRLAVFDTARRLDLAEKLLQMADTPRAEVAIDVELLEIGVRESAPLRDGGVRGPLPARLSGEAWARLKATTSAAPLLSSRLVAVDRESDRLVAIDRVPISATPLVAGPSPVPGNSATVAELYQEIGLVLEITPRVHGSDAVTLDFRLRAGNASGPAADADHPLPAFASRDIESSVRLRHGETYLLSGLLRAAGAAEPPARLPILGPLYAASPESPREVVLALTPRITPPDAAVVRRSQTLHIGSYSGLLDVSDHPAEPQPSVSQQDEARERVRERLRQRLRERPRSVPDLLDPESKPPGG